MAERVKLEEQWAPEEGQLEKVRARLMEPHDNEEITYTSCSANGCFDLCVLKVHHKNNRVTAIETDDTVNANQGREDEYTPIEEFLKGNIQHRACPRGRAMKDAIYSPTRLLHPMKRKHWSPEQPNGHLRGQDEYERISWDEALDTIADQYTKCREKYGPYSVWMDAICGGSYDPYAPYLPGGGCNGSGIDSFYPGYVADKETYGFQVNYKTWMAGKAWGGCEGPTILESKLIILWGFDTVLNYPEYQYWFQLAKEKGIPIIYIDPRYTNTAQCIATQYIPIRPGTDAAAMLAMAYVMFTEDLIDHEFLEKWVEPHGVELFKQYVLGEDSTGATFSLGGPATPKTPEWAENICGIPAETIVELARLYAANSPCYFRQVWAASRFVNGIDTARIYNYLNVLGGNVGKPGVNSTGVGFDTDHIRYLRHKLTPYLGNPAPEYMSPLVCEAEQWQRAVINRPKVDAGEMTMEEYKASVGCPQQNPAPNIHALIYLIESPRQFIGNYQDTSERIQAVKMLDFVAAAHWQMKASSNMYADILLPMSDWSLEGGSSSGYFSNGPFSYGLAPSLGNYFMYYNKCVNPPEDVRHPWWIEKEIGIRLGLGDKVMPYLKDATPENIDEYVDKCMGMLYENWAVQMMSDYPDDIVPKDWETFKKKPIIRIPMEGYGVKFQEEMEAGDPETFDTPTGKIQFYSEHFATDDPKGFSDMYGGSLGNPQPALARFRPSVESMFSPKTNKYPLWLVTPHSFFRQNMNGDANRWSRDEYRNSVWISVADAKQRGIKDGDMVLAFNDRGEVMVPAYVTTRITPGCACLIFGRYYDPNGMKTEKMPDGIDTWGNCNFLTVNNQYENGDSIGPLLCASLIEVQKVSGDIDNRIATCVERGE